MDLDLAIATVGVAVAVVVGLVGLVAFGPMLTRAAGGLLDRACEIFGGGWSTRRAVRRVPRDVPRDGSAGDAP